MPHPTDSRGSIAEANRYRAEKSRHGGAGAGGYLSPFDAKQAHSFLSRAGEVAIANIPAGGLQDFDVSVEWDNVAIAQEKNLLKRLFKKKIKRAGVDLDLGCLYELADGRRGGMQAFGKNHGAQDEAPYIWLTGDERTGDREGPDEVIHINGAHWADIKRLLLYVYIYEGAQNWAAVKPQLQVRVPGQPPMIVTLQAQKTHLPLCAVASLENIRGGIRMTSVLEYFPGHTEMDRAFGFGLEWVQGEKEPLQ